ncbi:MAG TPA: zinc ribbon domain-containing protein [Terriglobales bacterium]|nr:zinc ribbon domain-containing protein [Terriglobales bacterium]
MFCNRCGAPVQPDYRVCPKCAAPISGTVPEFQNAAVPVQSRLLKHIQPLGILWIIVGAFWLIPAIVMLVLGSVAHVFIPFSDAVGRALGPFVLHLMGIGFLVVAAAAFFAGWGLLQRRAWARSLAIVLGILALFHPPFATALGIYTLWVLLPADAQQEFARIAS